MLYLYVKKSPVRKFGKTNLKGGNYMVAICLLIFAMGFLVGGVVIAVVLYEKPVGTLRIDTSDPDEAPYLFVELSESVVKIYDKKQVTFYVNTQKYVSRK